jgi:hypothetical protein
MVVQQVGGEEVCKRHELQQQQQQQKEFVQDGKCPEQRLQGLRARRPGVWCLVHGQVTGTRCMMRHCATAHLRSNSPLQPDE